MRLETPAVARGGRGPGAGAAGRGLCTSSCFSAKAQCTGHKRREAPARPPRAPPRGAQTPRPPPLSRAEGGALRPAVPWGRGGAGEAVEPDGFRPPVRPPEVGAARDRASERVSGVTGPCGTAAAAADRGTRPDVAGPARVPVHSAAAKMFRASLPVMEGSRAAAPRQSIGALQWRRSRLLARPRPPRPGPTAAAGPGADDEPLSSVEGPQSSAYGGSGAGEPSGTVPQVPCTCTGTGATDPLLTRTDSLFV